MPDFWSHQYAALEALNANNILITDDARSLYLFGAQGPDFFYYINKMNPFTKKHYGSIGNLIHEKQITKQFESMLHYLSAHPTPENIAYFAGYLSHYILDVHCHPLICKLGPDSDSHKRVEMALDALCFKQIWHKALKDLDIHPFICNRIQMSEHFTPFWIHHLDHCFEINIDTESLAKANKHMVFIQNLLLKNRIRKIPFVPMFSRLMHYDLSMLTYPDDIQPETYQFETFKTSYLLGIQVIKEAFESLTQVLSETMTIDDFIKNHIHNDFLGENLNDQ